MVFNQLVAWVNFCTEGVFQWGLVESEEMIRFKNIIRYKRSYGVTAVVYFFLIGGLQPFVDLGSD
jgi:hypothetical protein